MTAIATAAARTTAADLLRFLSGSSHDDLHLGWLSRAQEAAGDPPPADFVAMVEQELAQAIATLPQGNVATLYRGLQERLRDDDSGRHWSDSFTVALRYGPHTYGALAMANDIDWPGTLARRISWPDEREVSLVPQARLRPIRCHAPLPNVLAESQLVDDDGLVVAYHSGEQPLCADRIRPNLHLGSYAQAQMRGGKIITRVRSRPAPATRLRDRGEDRWCPRRLRSHVRKGRGYLVYLNRHEGIDLEEFRAAVEVLPSLDRLPDNRFRKHVPSAHDSLILLDPSLVVDVQVLTQNGPN